MESFPGGSAVMDMMLERLRWGCFETQMCDGEPHASAGTNITDIGAQMHADASPPPTGAGELVLSSDLGRRRLALSWGPLRAAVARVGRTSARTSASLGRGQGGRWGCGWGLQGVGAGLCLEPCSVEFHEPPDSGEEDPGAWWWWQRQMPQMARLLEDDPLKEGLLAPGKGCLK